MAVPSAPAGTGSIGLAAQPHDRGYHALTISKVVRETDDAVSLVLDIPAELRSTYSYAAGQFLTFRVSIDGQTVYRSYSMSSAPESDSALAVTVKRVPGGAVSNWINDLSPGDVLDASPPAGKFRLGPKERGIVAFAAGSGITPIYSLIKSAMLTTSRPVRLLYANRSPGSVIFAEGLADLLAHRGDRLDVRHRYDEVDGFVDAAAVAEYVKAARDCDVYICGPGPFMDVVESALLAVGVAADQIHIERFNVAETAAPDAPVDPSADAAVSEINVTIEIDGRKETTKYRRGATILQTARQAGLKPPSSCEAGNCATCMAKCVEGEVTMRVNDALFEDEVADGWILTCQSEPTTPTVHVIYGYEG
ncbi:MAG TPA: ferredoxin--NADP reductase [Mycobacteriales bacterium]|nr:ferredoxin--NADP reductase [Mycobacteriales bacterium]